MSDYKEIHNEAMDLAERAISEKNKNNSKEALELNCQAFEKEKKVALASVHESEPLRSILLRSAATLGYRSNNLEEAEKLIQAVRLLFGKGRRMAAEEDVLHLERGGPRPHRHTQTPRRLRSQIQDRGNWRLVHKILLRRVPRRRQAEQRHGHHHLMITSKIQQNEIARLTKEIEDLKKQLKDLNDEQVKQRRATEDLIDPRRCRQHL